MNLIKLYILLAILLHGGRTDSRGGHTDRSTGRYHYHHGYPAHSHTNGCPYDYRDNTGASDYSPRSSSKSDDDSNLASIILYIIIGSFVILFIYAYVAGYLDRKKREKEEKQKILDEKNRIKNLVKRWEQDHSDNIKSIETKIKLAKDAYKDGRIKDKYWVAYNLGSLYKDLGKLKEYNVTEAKESIEWINLGKDLFTDLVTRNKKLNNTDLKLRVRLSDYFYLRAQAYALNDKYNAMLDYNYIIEKTDYSIEAYYERALLKKELGSYESALEDVNYFLSKTKNHRGYNLRAILSTILRPLHIYKDQKPVIDNTMINEAIEDYRTSISLKKDQTEAYQEKAFIEEYYLRDKDKAIETIENGLKVNKDNPKLIYSLFLLYKRKANFNKALDLSEKLFLYEPQFSFLTEPKEENNYFGFAYFLRSEIYKVRGDVNSERNDLRKSLMYKIDRAIIRYLDITSQNN